MSFDVLPPGEEPRRPEEAAASTEQGASEADAPPVVPSRSRKRKSTGTDAASSEDANKDQMPRPARRSKKETVTVPVENAPEQEKVIVVPEIPEKSETKRTPVRSRSKKTTTAVPADISAEIEPVVAATDTASVIVDAAADNSSTSQTTRRRPRSPRNPQPVVENNDALPIFETQPESGLLDGQVSSEKIAAKTTPSSRRKAKRPANNPVETKLSQETVQEEPAPVAQTTVETSDPVPALSISQRKRRRSRNKRKVDDPPVLEVLIETPTIIPLELPEPEPFIDLEVGAHLVVRKSTPTIFINGYAYPPALFFGNMQEESSYQTVQAQIRLAAEAGVHLHSTLIELYAPHIERHDVFAVVDRVIQLILQADPNGYVMPRIVFVPAKGWKREHPDELTSFEDGSPGDPSINSDLFWSACEEALIMLIRHLKSQPWGSRVFAFHLERGEWFQSASSGYDLSLANRDAFRRWVETKYHNSVPALRAAWQNSDITFSTVNIPAPQAAPNAGRAFYHSRRDRPTLDFYEFTSDTTADRIISLAKVIKKATDYNAIVSVCYGYTFEFTHGNSGHLSLQKLLSSRYVDIISGPASYKDREIGGAASLPAPVASVLLHGKLWITEDDTRTWLAPPSDDPNDFNHQFTDIAQTESAYIRAIGRAITHRTGLCFMDLWGEGWLNDASIWMHIKHFVHASQSNSEVNTPEVVVLVDEVSLRHLQKGESFFRNFTANLRNILQRSGTNYALHLQSDIVHPDFPTTAKLYLFASPFRLPATHREAIRERLQSGGKTLAWVFAAAVCEDKPASAGIAEESTYSTVGLILHPQPFNSYMGSKVTQPNHPIMKDLNKEFGSHERLVPSLFVDDPEAVVLAEYQDSGLPSLALRVYDSWKSVFIGEHEITDALFKGLCRYAGVNIYATGSDTIDIGNGWISLHSKTAGFKVINMPPSSELYELKGDTAARVYPAGKNGEFRYFQQAGTTHHYYMGTIGRLQSLGFAVSLPVSTVSSSNMMDDFSIDSLPEPEPYLPEPEPHLPEPSNSDLETLRMVLAMEIPLDDIPDIEMKDEIVIAPPDEEQKAASAALLRDMLSSPDINGNRRRRRRGGRGRGRRVGEGANETDNSGGRDSSSG